MYFGQTAVVKHSEYNSQSSEFCPELALYVNVLKKNIVYVPAKRLFNLLSFTFICKAKFQCFFKMIDTRAPVWLSL